MNVKKSKKNATSVRKYTRKCVKTFHVSVVEKKYTLIHTNTRA